MQVWEQALRGGSSPRFLILAVVFAAILFATSVWSSPPESTRTPQTVFFGGDAAYPPFESLERNSAVGFNVDLAKNIAATTDTRVEHRLGDWPDTIAALKNGEVDVVPMFVSDQRRDDFLFTSPFYYVEHRIYARRESAPAYTVSDLAGRRVAVEARSYAHQRLSASDFNVAVVPTGNTVEALQAVVERKADYAILAKPTAASLIRSLQVPIQGLGPPFWPAAYAFAVRKDRTDLLNWLQTAMDTTVQTGHYQAVYDRWEGNLGRMTGDVGRAQLTTLVVLLTLLLIAAISFGWSWSMRRVRARTHELRSAVQRTRRPESAASMEPDSDNLAIVSLFAANQLGGLYAEYQPQIDLKSGKVTGAEALARLNHPTLGAIPPGRFIPLVEQAGLVSLVTQKMIDEAVRLSAFLRREGLASIISVNITVSELTESDLLGVVEQALGTYEGNPRDLKLELTETSVASDFKYVKDVLQQLETIGIRISVDDFGTGYSSLSYLSFFPIHEVKIDRYFVCDMTTNSKNRRIVRSTILMANELELECVAEGAEDTATLRMLSEYGCDRVQGFVIAKPLPEAEFLTFLHQHVAGDYRQHSDEQ